MNKLIPLLLLCCGLIYSQKKDADLIIYNAKIYTADARFSTAEAMAVAKGKIAAIGNNEAILKSYQSQNKQDVAGRTVLPGLIDAHCHFTGYAKDLWKCDLWGTQSWEEVVQRMVTYSKTAPQEWLYGRSWDQNDWPVKDFPDKQRLDELFPNRPVYLKRIDGHAVVANQKALDIAGITVNTKVQGGEIEVKNGQLTGILLDNAKFLIEKHIPEINDETALKYFTQLQETCFSLGLTSVHDCGISEHTLSQLEQSQRQGTLKMKVFALLNDDPAYYGKWIRKGRYRNGNITVGGFKVYSDGALGSRGACLLHDYEDQPGRRGFLLGEEEHFRTLARKLKNSDLQMCTHAIGDSANRTILNVYGEVLGGKNDRRWRIEHAQIVTEKDRELFGLYSIIPSVQPTHATSDMYWAESRLGAARMKTAYAYQDLLQQNKWLPLGTDFPVEEINPLKTFFAAVARQDEHLYPAGGFQKENALTREQALRGMTIWAARAAFQENELGSLEVGKSADFVIISQNIMAVEEARIPETVVLETFSSGNRVYYNHQYYEDFARRLAAPVAGYIH